MIARLTLLFLAFALIACQQSKTTNTNSMTDTSESNAIYVGTYTQKLPHVDGKAAGIYKLVMVDGKYALDTTFLIDGIVNPTFLTTYGDYLVAASEAVPNGEVYLIKDNRVVHKLPSNGGAACHVAVNEDLGLITVSNYMSGTITAYGLKGDSLIQLSVINEQGKRENSRQESSHFHSTIFDKKNNRIIAANLGTDKLYTYTVSKEGINVESKIEYTFDELCGARHMALNEAGNLLYVACELSSEVAVFDISSDSLVLIQKISTLPLDYKEQNTVADIHITKSGKYLYASNRGSNSLAAFSISVNGSLTPLGNYSTKGTIPRNFMITSDDTTVLAANQNSDNIAVFKLQGDGSLVFDYEIACLSPVCLTK